MAIQTQQLTKKFGNFTAVNAIDLNVPSGQVFGFLGPNGSGKTTTIRLLLGLLKPTSGTATILGQDIRHSRRDLLQNIGYMSQKFSLYSDLTVEENLRFFGRSYGLRGAELRQQMDFVLDMAGLHGHENTRTDELSGGWAQRLALGSAIIHQPKLVFLDEPTAGVDPVSRREFWDLLYDLTQAGITIFVTTHYMDEAEHCEQVSFIYYGNIIAQGTPQNIVQATIPGEIVSFEPSNPVTAKQQLQSAMQNRTIDVQAVSLFGAAVHVITQDAPSVEQYLYANFNGTGNLNGVQRIAPSLEDAFIELVHQADAVR